jgi:hypothetical protein
VCAKNRLDFLSPQEALVRAVKIGKAEFSSWADTSSACLELAPSVRFWVANAPTARQPERRIIIPPDANLMQKKDSSLLSVIQSSAVLYKFNRPNSRRLAASVERASGASTRLSQGNVCNLLTET